MILDGTVLPIDRIAADRPYYSGKKKHHGINVQVLADPAGRLVWASDALPGATHDLTAARVHGIPAALAENDVKCWADKAYQGAGPAIRVPIRGNHLRGWRRRHTAITPRSAASARTRHGHPQVLAAPAKTSLQHHPDQRPRPSRRRSRTRHLIKMEKPHSPRQQPPALHPEPIHHQERLAQLVERQLKSVEINLATTIAVRPDTFCI